MFSAYFDASGNRSTTGSALVVAGAVSDERKWDKFVAEWDALLHQQAVDAFHMTDFVGRQKAFKDKWQGQEGIRANFLRSLVETFVKRTNKIIGTIVVLEDYEKANQRYMLDEKWGGPYALAGYISVGKILKWASRNGHKNIQVMFEDGDSGKGKLDALVRERLFVAPIFMPKRSDAKPCRQFEGADLAAWECRRMLKSVESDETVRRSFEALDRKAHDWGLLYSDPLERMCKDQAIPERT